MALAGTGAELCPVLHQLKHSLKENQESCRETRIHLLLIGASLERCVWCVAGWEKCGYKLEQPRRGATRGLGHMNHGERLGEDWLCCLTAGELYMGSH